MDMYASHADPRALVGSVVLAVVLLFAVAPSAHAGMAKQPATPQPAAALPPPGVADDSPIRDVERIVSDVHPTGAYTIHLPLISKSGPPPSSSELIAQALARGQIDSETALVYNVYAIFVDARLPAIYQGDDSRLRDSTVMRQIRGELPSLTSPTQALLAPFLLPPSAPGSWLELREAPSRAARESDRALAAPTIQWKKELVGDKPAVVWWQTRYQEDEAKAKTIASELSTAIWPLLTSLMGEPITDAGLTNNGGDPRLDIYLIHKGSKGDYGLAEPYLDVCSSTPAPEPGFMLINTQKKDWLRNTVAHEFFHILQMRYKIDCGKKDYGWLLESTATWAEDVAYPDDQSEWIYLSDFLDLPNTPLEDTGIPRKGSPNPHFYGAYLWPFYLSHATPGPGKAVVPAIFARSESQQILQSVNDSIPGGFKQQWPEFVLRNWNTDPVEDYQSWDKLYRSIPDFKITYLNGGLGGASMAHDDLLRVEETNHLAASYYRIILDNDVHRVTFFNGLDYKLSQAMVKGAIGYNWTSDQPSWQTLKWEAGEAISAQNREYVHIWMIPSVNGIWQEPEDLTKKAYRTFCRDVFDQAVDELIFIVSNSAWADQSFKPIPEGKPPTLLYSNIPCGSWKGEIHSTPPLSGVQITADVTGIELVADKLVGDPPESPTGFLIGTAYVPVAGTLRTSGVFNISDSCTVDMNHYSHGVGRSFPGDGHLLTVNEFALDDFFGRYAMLFADPTHGDMVCDDGTTGPWPAPGFGAGMWPLSLVISDNPGYQNPFSISVYDAMHVSLNGRLVDGDKTVGFAGKTYSYRWSFAPDSGP